MTNESQDQRKTGDSQESPDRPASLLIFLHGLGDTPLSWQDQVVAMGAGWRPMTPWIVGTRPIDSGDFDLGAASEAIARIPQLHGLSTVSLCGRSLGAAVAIRLASDYPELVDRLILVDPLLGLPGWARVSQRAAVRLMPRARLAARNVDKDRLLAAIDALGKIDVTDRLGKIKTPALVVDEAGNPQVARSVAEAIPGARWTALGDGGLNAAIWDFLPTGRS